jgi:hypothetical protein
MQIASFSILIVKHKLLCARSVPAHDEKVRKPLLQAHFTAERLCLCIGGEVTDEDPPPLFPLQSLQRCGESSIASLSIVGDDLLSFGPGLEAMDLNGIRFTCFP